MALRWGLGAVAAYAAFLLQLRLWLLVEPYAPDEAYAALLAFRADARLWGKYGFKDAFNPGRRWVADRYIGIDQGPIVIMIENHRTRLLWRLFMSHPAIGDPSAGLLRKLADAGWTITPQRY